MLSFSPVGIPELRQRWLDHHEHVLRSSIATIRRCGAMFNYAAKDQSLAGLGMPALASARTARLYQRQALSTHIQTESAVRTRPATTMPAMPAEKLGKWIEFDIGYHRWGDWLGWPQRTDHIREVTGSSPVLPLALQRCQAPQGQFKCFQI